MRCEVAIRFMHEYLSGDLAPAQQKELMLHLQECPSCRERFEELERTEAALRLALDVPATKSYQEATASEALKQRIMQQLPQTRQARRNRFVRLIYRYPGLTAAAVFLLIMIASAVVYWDQDNKLILAGDDLQQVVIAEGNRVIVPESAHIKGNLIIENGYAEVLGKVDGDVTVIDGDLFLASTGYIAGKSRTIDQALDWFWYQVTQTWGHIAKQ